MGDLDGAMNAYEQALRHNQSSIPAMNAIACILRTKEQFPKAIEFLHHILRLDAGNGETWGSLGVSSSTAMLSMTQLTAVLGHCNLMMDNLQDAYTSYQQALYHLRDPKVGSHRRVPIATSLRNSFRSRGFGTESASYMIATAPSIMQRKPSPKSCAWHPISTRPMRSTSA